MRTARRLILVAWVVLAPAISVAQPVETEIPNVTAELVELRSAGGVLRLAVQYVNSGAKPAESSWFSIKTHVTLVDVKSKKKYFPLKDASGEFIGGPIQFHDRTGGGSLRVHPKQPSLLWAYFEPLPAGTVVSVEVPTGFPFDDVRVTEGPGKILAAKTARSTSSGGVATIVSARRADQTLTVRLRIETEKGMSPPLTGSYFEFRHVTLLDPIGKRTYQMLKDTEGYWQGLPNSVKNVGRGSFLLNWGKATLVSLTFPAPPDTVKSVDLFLPYFLPFEAVPIEGLGGAAESGMAASGKTLGLEGALKELNAEVSAAEIRIDLAADVLFDFDKADIKPDAEPQLTKVATVINAHPDAKIAIEGHTDGKGADAYNQDLSEKRAESVKQWLVAKGQVNGGNVATRGWGRSKPIASNAKPDGSDDPAARAKNRRVQIIVRKGA